MKKDKPNVTMKTAIIIWTLFIIGYLTSAYGAAIDYAGAVIYFSSGAGSTTPPWNRYITDQRNEEDISIFSFSPNADIQIDVASVTNQGTYYFEVTSTQFIWKSSATNISQVAATGAAANGSGDVSFQVNGSNSSPMSFVFEGTIASSATNTTSIEYTFQLVHNDGAYAKQILTAGVSNFTEYGSIPDGIFIFSISHQQQTEQSTSGASTLHEQSEFILTLFDQAVTNVLHGQSNLLFQISGHPDALYYIQTTSNLTDGAWMDNTNQITGSDTRHITIPLSSNANQMYYRSEIK